MKKHWVNTEIEPNIILPVKVTMYCLKKYAVIWYTRELENPFYVYSNNFLVDRFPTVKEAIENVMDVVNTRRNK